MRAGKSTPPFRVRVSPIHGSGVFAVRRIRPGQQLIDYLGQRLSGEALKARLADMRAINSPHTFLFRLNPKLYVDAAVDGNDARFINHSCDPNCESSVEGDRITISSIKNIQPGVELTYDYSLEIEKNPSASRLKLFACRCGAIFCRGSMLDLDSLVKPARRPKPAGRTKKTAQPGGKKRARANAKKTPRK
jgi:SET domain-containing protein